MSDGVGTVSHHDELGDHDMDVEFHLNQIERHTAAIRGEEPPDISPADFRLPTGRDLRRLREKCGLSVEQAAEEIGYSPNYLYNIENGGKAPGRKCIKKCMLLYRREWPQGGGL